MRQLTSVAALVVMVLGLCLPALAQTVTRGPYLQSGSLTSMIVRWRTDVATDGRVRYGTDPTNLTAFVENPALTAEHQVTLAGLLPDTRYYYSVGTSTATLAGGDASHFFTTSPTAGTSKAARIWVIGDSGTADANAAAVRNAYLTFTGTRYTDLWLMLGDNAYVDGTDSEYQAAVFDMYPTLLRQTVLWPTIGNHDGHSADSATQTGVYYDIFSLPKQGEAGGLASGTEAYYSFNYGNMHFIVLDSFETSRSSSGPMMTWLQSDLANNTQPWVIAFWHHPPYSKGSHNSDTETELVQMRQNALPILEAGGVDLVLSGHSHSYERSFLIDGHYGSSSTFTQSMKKDGGDGRVDGTGEYQKPALDPIPNAGAVYAVAGSSGQTSGGSLNHPVMFISLNTLGSMVLDVDGNRLDALFLDSTGVRRDYFTIVKGGTGGDPDLTPPSISSVAASSITASGATIAWTTNETSDTQVEYGLTTTYGTATPLDPAQVTAHSQTLSGLAASTVYHYRVKSRDAAGNLATSGDFPLTTLAEPDTTPPTVSLTAPAGSAVVAGSVTVSATASDSVGVVGVQFRVDGSNLGSEDPTAPYSVSWDTTTATNGSHTLTAVARDAAGNNTMSGSVTVTVSNPSLPALNISTTSLPAATVGTAYSQTLTATGGTTPYTWSRSSGTLPPGLALSSAGVLSGTPTTAGTFSFTVRVTDSASATETQPLNLTVNASPPAPSPTSDSAGAGCFIATAAFGSPLEPQVVLLRAFRDRYFLTNPPGQAFIQWYYRTSPPIAAGIRQSPRLKSVVQMILWPLVGVAWLALHPTMGGGLLLGAGGLTGWICSRRKRFHRGSS